MSATEEYEVNEVLNEIADGPAPDDEYVLCLRVEREINGIRGRGIPWQEIHAAVHNWLRP